MIYRILAGLCLLLGLGLLAASVCLYFYPPEAWPDEPRVVIEEPERVFEEPVPGQEYVVQFPVHNKTGRTRRVVGAPTC